MKKVLLIALLLVPFADAKDSRLIQLLDSDEDAQIQLYCINKYVFAGLESGDALTQVYDSRGPMTCEEYVEDTQKAVNEGIEEAWED